MLKSRLADQLIGPSLKRGSVGGQPADCERLADQLIGPSLKRVPSEFARYPVDQFGRSIDRPFIEAALM